MPYYDVKPSDPFFQSVQKIGATGILKGMGQPYQWANRTWFYPDSSVKGEQLAKDLLPFGKLDPSLRGAITIGHQKWKIWGLSNFDKGRNITRAEMAVLLDKTIDPFRREIDHHGNLK